MRELGRVCCMNGHSRPRTAADCLAQIDRADVVFAWLDELEPSEHCTAYGTRVEVGYALARGKHVLVGASRAPQEPGDSGIAARSPIDDVWFAWTVASQRVIARSPLAALDEIAVGGRAWR
ncbi:nucleoside 2-deoxyribosyltransferase [Cellulomonas sp. NPDC058312]|uniref:nucleoside 2-deoxyribosyltransferase n=1 Tax=Cellulomonas sp. NPDC058312 TaxID=3346441 RepID=UPI0036E01EE5